MTTSVADSNPGPGTDPVELLEGFVRRFGAGYLDPGGRVDHARLVAELESTAPGHGGVVHGFETDGSSVLTGLSYQTSIEQVLNAVVSGLAVDVRSGVRRLDSSGPLADLVSRRAAGLADDDFVCRATRSVHPLAALRIGEDA